MIGGLIYVGMFFSAILAGLIGDRVGRQPVLLVAILTFGLCLVAARVVGRLPLPPRAAGRLVDVSVGEQGDLQGPPGVGAESVGR